MFVKTVPLPNFKEVFKTLFKNNIFSLDKVYLQGEKSSFRFYSRGSDAIACVSRAFGGERPVVFVPSYFCNASLDDLRNSMAKIVFYNTNIDLTPDWKHVEELSEIYSPDIFILTHYFGMVNDVSGAAYFFNNGRCKLIHDCAHHLLPCDEILSAPGIVLFSPHKVLPLPPLSFVLCSNQDIESLGRPEYCSIKAADFRWLLKRILQKYFSRFVKYNLSDEMPDLGGGIVERTWFPSRVSRFSMLFFSAACSIISIAGSSRDSNYKCMYEKISAGVKNNYKVRVLELNKKNTSYVFIISVPASLQKEIHTYMRRHRIPVNTWPDLPPEVISNPDVFGDSIELRKTMLLFPIHQDITEKEIDYISNNLLEKISGIELTCGV